MGNILADQIERFIMQKFLDEREKEIILQRKEIADELNCAPSQISYVLNTRFSDEQGFIVESKRGLGGFIRITIVEPEKNVRKKGAEDIPFPTLADIDKSLYLSLRDGAITQREAQLLHEVFAVLYRERDLDVRKKLVKQVRNRVAALLKEE